MNAPPLPPMSREAMRGFKVKVEEEQRVKQIQDLVKHIYWGATEQAKVSTDSVYKYAIPAQLVTSRPQKKEILFARGMTPKEEKFMNQQALYQNSSTGYVPSEFISKNMPDILQELRDMFPQCLVKHARLVKAQDGKMYDMDTIDEKVLPFIDQSQSQEYITVDWT